MRFQRFIQIREEINNNLWPFHPQIADALICSEDMIDESINWENSNVEIVKNNSEQVSLKFKYRDLSYLFNAIKLGSLNIWDIQYSLIGRPEFNSNDLFKKLDSGEINNKVLAAVFKCIKAFIKLKHPEKITFSSTDDRLIYFYDVINAQFEKRLNCIRENRKVSKDKNGNISVAWLYKINYGDNK